MRVVLCLVGVAATTASVAILWALSTLRRVNTEIKQIKRRTHRNTTKPFRLFLVRHGESEGNVDPIVYFTTPDAKIPLTPRGHLMGIESGKAIREELKKLYPNKPARVVIYVSSFKRATETACGVLEGLDDLSGWVWNIRESPLLVEQDWGMFESTGLEGAKTAFPSEWNRLLQMKRHQGRFWSRFPLGESCFDVCQRIQLFFGLLIRECVRRVTRDDVVIIISHGITLRAFAMMWCEKTFEWFEHCHNPPAASVRLLDSTVENWDAGYIFGGYKLGSDLDSPVDVKELDDNKLSHPQANMTVETFIQRHQDREKSRQFVPPMLVSHDSIGIDQLHHFATPPVRPSSRNPSAFRPPLVLE